jgi:O-antigen ligase/thioredoxin-like negative regulator of GroEL
MKSAGVVAAVLFAGAVTASLFFHGVLADYFVLTQLALLGALFAALWSRHGHRIVLPLTPLAVTLTLYWAWLGLTLVWGNAAYHNLIGFWWLGSLPFAFWIYTLLPEPDRAWRLGSRPVVAIAVALALHGLWQLVAHGWAPKSVFLDINSCAAFLVLVALPLGARFLTDAGRQPARAALAGVSLFVLVAAVGATGGRGVMLALLIAAALLIALGAKHAPRRASFGLVAILAIGLVAGNLLAAGRPAARMLTLADPLEGSGAVRLMIWERSVELIREAPWTGHGLGSFTLLFAARQDPGDDSAGFMAHNDYLQLWLEGGLPALVLLVAVFIATAMAAWRVMRVRYRERGEALESAGLLAGLVAIAAHSAVNFNLYVLPTLLVVGAMLGRLHELRNRVAAPRVIAINALRRVRPAVYRLLLILVLLVPASYWIAVSLGNYFFQEAVHLATAGRYDEADAALARAAQLSPGAEITLVARADLYRHVIGAAPATASAQKRELFEQALASLRQAEQLNPHRAEIFLARARLWRQLAEAGGPDWRERAANGFERAIGLRPRYFAARLEYARLLLDAGRRDVARQVLEAGLEHYRIADRAMIPYYRLVASLRHEAGEVEAAQALERDIAAINTASAEALPLPAERMRIYSLYDAVHALRAWLPG